MGKWVHVGRLNTPLRFERFAEVMDSFDGSGLALFGWMRQQLTRGFPLFDQPDRGSADAGRAHETKAEQ